MTAAEAIENRERLLQLGDTPDPEPTDAERQAAAYDEERARLAAQAGSRWGKLVTVTCGRCLGSGNGKGADLGRKCKMCNGRGQLELNEDEAEPLG